MENQTETSFNGLFHATSFQSGGIASAFLANIVIYALLLFADTRGDEIHLTVPIIALTLFTVVWKRPL